MKPGSAKVCCTSLPAAETNIQMEAVLASHNHHNTHYC